MLQIKKAIFTFLFLTVTLLGYSQNILPRPSNSFLKTNKTNENIVYDYFKKYVGSVSGKKNKKYFIDCQENCLCYWEETFKKNIKFKQDTCSESGILITIDFVNYSKIEIVKLIDLFYNYPEYNSWNNDKTKYGPIEDGDAGCYADIQFTNKGKIRLTIYCGC